MTGTVRYVDERHGGQPQFVDHDIGRACRSRTAIGKIDLVPFKPGIGKRLAHRKHALIAPRTAIGAAKRVDPRADNIDVFAHAALSGANANVELLPSNGTITRRIAIPSLRSASVAPTSRDSTITSPGNST